jgi:transcription initiation factor TFIID subunit 13
MCAAPRRVIFTCYVFGREALISGIKVYGGGAASSKPRGRPKGRAANDSIGPRRANLKKKRLFTRELQHMMYGFGDVPNPAPESVDLLEELVIEFVTEMTQKAMQVSAKRGKLQMEDLIFLIRKDKKKYDRVAELLRMHEELKRARKAFDDNTLIKDIPGAGI